MRLLEMIWQDSVYALRAIRQKPVFAATAVLTLALAIGGNTAMFSVIRAVLLKPLAYSEPDRLVRMSGGETPTLFAEMKGAHSFTELGAFTSEENITLSGDVEPEVLKGERVSASFLRILGVEPVARARFSLEDEDRPGAAPVAMISSELWRRRFSGDPQIVGKTATLGSTAFTIIGVLPPRFQFPAAGVDVWMTAPAEWPLMSAKSRVDSPFLSVFGRLKPGFNLAQANAEMQVIRRQYAMAHPDMLDAKPKTPEVTAMKDELVGEVRSMLWMLFGAVGFVLLVACANVASLLLARATSRSREFAVRSALGAARLRLIGQLLAESILLSLCRRSPRRFTGCLDYPRDSTDHFLRHSASGRNSSRLDGVWIRRGAFARNRRAVRIGAVHRRIAARSHPNIASKRRGREVRAPTEGFWQGSASAGCC